MTFGPGVFFIWRYDVKDKVFKTCEEQLAILKSRGIDFGPRGEYGHAKNIIQRESYYKLINGTTLGTTPQTTLNGFSAI